MGIRAITTSEPYARAIPSGVDLGLPVELVAWLTASARVAFIWSMISPEDILPCFAV